MNTKQLCTLIIFILSGLSFNSFAQNELSGKITDKTTNAGIPFANVYIEDLKIGGVSGPDGSYSIKNLPEGTYVIGVHLLGYEGKIKTVKIKGVTSLDFTLSSSDIEEQEVVVTGTATARGIDRNPQPVVEVSNSYLMQTASTNIIDALSSIPGVSGISDGQSICKPVIRGLGYNRVLTVNDGVVQEGQQWGDEFGIEVDPNSVDRIEILKGPASLVYGSDAMSGVINFLPEKTLPEGEIKGDFLNSYQTNNGLINNAGHIAGTVNGITFSGRIDNTMAHAYQNAKDGYVFNTQFSNFNTDGTIGIHRKWGFSELHGSYFELRTGIADNVKDSTGAFMKQDVDPTNAPIEKEATNQELHSYTPFVINQLVKHTKLVWDNSIALGQGRIIARVAWQQNSRQENNDITMPNTSNIWYYMNSYNYDFRYVSPTINGYDFTVGANGVYQNSQNKGTLLLIPEYDLFDIGGFAIANKQMDKLTLSGGIRYDMRKFSGHAEYIDSSGNHLNANDPGAIARFAAYTSNFNGLSASLGATYQVNDNVYLKANVAKGFRAPNVAESGSNGIHDGTVVYEIGDPTLKPESSLEFDFTPGIKTENVTAEVSVFYNSINNFIYAKQLGDSVNNSTIGFPNAAVFLYTQTDAVLSGAEAVLDIHPASVKWFDWYTCFSTVDAQLKNVPDTVKYMPFVPPARLKSEFTFTFKKLSNVLNNTYFRIGGVYNFEQSHVYQQASVYNGAPGVIPAAPAYFVLNAGFGTDIMSHGHKSCSIYVAINNLLDNAYIDYMSRYKYNQNVVNGVTQPGVCNMGRNISLKLLVPIDFTKK